MLRSTSLTVAAFAALTTTALAGGDLDVGDRAPRLDSVRWIKGEPVGEFERGKVYAIEFWAPWCGPCRQSIPQMTQLAQQYDDVTFIGVSIWPIPDMQPTAEFVAEQGDAMDYVVAEDIHYRTSDAWMDAAGRDEIPCAMVVDRNGELAWIGHPLGEFEEALSAAVAAPPEPETSPRPDLVTRGAAPQPDASVAEVVMETMDKRPFENKEAERSLLVRLQVARTTRDWESVISLADQLIGGNPFYDGRFVSQKYIALLRSRGPVEASAYGHDVVAGLLHDNAGGLNELAWIIVDPQGEIEAELRDLDLAMKAAVRADELTYHRNAAIIDTVARVHFWNGNLKDALHLQIKAVDLVEPDTGLAAGLHSALEEYIEAAEAR